MLYYRFFKNLYIKCESTSFIYSSLLHFTQFSLSIYLSTYLHYIVAYFMLRLCSSLGLLFAMLFIFPLPFRASDCVHNFLPIFIVCLVVYFAVHNLCLGSSTPIPPLSLILSAPAAACLCCADSRILPLPVGSPAPPTLFCHLSGVAIFCASCA